MYRGEAILKRVAVVILGGGRGTRLFPLTERRAKPAISFGGKYRLIDIPISNSLNSGIRKIFVLTQFLSAGLHSHISRTYHMDGFSDGFVEILAAEQTPTSKDWYQGTADALRQSLRYLLRTPVDHVLILAGDQFYRMDFRLLLETHLQTGADVTVAATLAPEEVVPRLGVLEVGEGQRLARAVEKPADPEAIARLEAPEHVRSLFTSGWCRGRHLVSMGIYLLRKNALVDLLREAPGQDFAGSVVPVAVERGRAVYHPFAGYWVDVGTLRSYFDANLSLVDTVPPFNLYDPENPLFSRHRNLPAPKVTGTRVDGALIADGSIIEGAELARVVVGLRSVIRPGTKIRNSVLMGNDYYAHEVPAAEGRPAEPGIGRDCVIENAVLDKNVVVGDGCRIVGRAGEPDREGDGWTVRDGIVVIRHGATLPPGTVV
ncbi:MAG: NTP transferase domain-containing protein [Candidatus Eisenbacteria bacterium]|nr:NTP transferase domain-containing protein [Candidatus Eisenbacteria bacterium]